MPWGVPPTVVRAGRSGRVYGDDHAAKVLRHLGWDGASQLEQLEANAEKERAAAVAAEREACLKIVKGAPNLYAAIALLKKRGAGT